MSSINTEIASKLKSACIGIGLRKDTKSVPFIITGTGFLIDPEGYFVTATHVMENLENQILSLKNNEYPEIQLAVVRIENEEGSVKVHTDSTSIRAKLSVIPPNYRGPEKYDVTIGRLQGKFTNLPHLKIKKPCKLELYKEILMCGYPGGWQTLDLNFTNTGLKTNSVMQKGMISSIMPADSANKPIGIITDIIGTGGSSGSPIVYADDGEVVSLAQNVVTTENLVPLKNENNDLILRGTSKIGLTYGVSNYYLEPAVNTTLAQLKSLVDENGMPLKEMKGEILETVVDEGGNVVKEIK